MAASKREREAGGAGSSRLQLPLQVALGAALALLVLGWNSQRSSTAPQPQQPQLYVNDLSLPLDVGAVERQVRRPPAAPVSCLPLSACWPACCPFDLQAMCMVAVGETCSTHPLLCLQDEADLWCAPRPAPSWPPTDEQLRQLRVAVVIDPVCHRCAGGNARRRRVDRRTSGSASTAVGTRAGARCRPSNSLCYRARTIRGCHLRRRSRVCRQGNSKPAPVMLIPAVCRQEQMPEEKLKACLDVIISHCRDTTKNGCFGGWGNKAPEVRRRGGLATGVSPPGSVAHVACRCTPSLLSTRLLPFSLQQCKDVLPLDKWPDGTRPPVKWGHYQLWWQTIMTSIAPHLRTGGWGNLK